jgi:tRNA(Ile)-lysidine synthase
MNLLRGSGPRGLCGIPPIRENQFIRPLIQMPKARILEFLKDKDQAFVLDSSNADEYYLRNKIRHSLIPMLEQEFNPETLSCLDRLSQILRQEDDFLEEQTNQVFHACMIKQEKALIAMSIQKLNLNHPALVNRVLRQAIAWVKKDLKRITLAHIQDILVFIASAESGKSLDLPGKIRVYKDRDMLYFKKETLGLRELGRKKKQSQLITKRKSGKKT